MRTWNNHTSTLSSLPSVGNLSRPLPLGQRSEPAAFSCTDPSRRPSYYRDTVFRLKCGHESSLVPVVPPLSKLNDDDEVFIYNRHTTIRHELLRHVIPPLVQVGVRVLKGSPDPVDPFCASPREAVLLAVSLRALEHAMLELIFLEEYWDPVERNDWMSAVLSLEMCSVVIWSEIVDQGRQWHCHQPP